jgi:hypothetical protein
MFGRHDQAIQICTGGCTLGRVVKQKVLFVMAMFP